MCYVILRWVEKWRRGGGGGGGPGCHFVSSSFTTSTLITLILAVQVVLKSACWQSRPPVIGSRWMALAGSWQLSLTYKLISNYIPVLNSSQVFHLRATIPSFDRHIGKRLVGYLCTGRRRTQTQSQRLTRLLTPWNMSRFTSNSLIFHKVSEFWHCGPSKGILDTIFLNHKRVLILLMAAVHLAVYWQPFTSCEVQCVVTQANLILTDIFISYPK